MRPPSRPRPRRDPIDTSANRYGFSSCPGGSGTETSSSRLTGRDRTRMSWSRSIASARRTGKRTSSARRVTCCSPFPGTTTPTASCSDPRSGDFPIHADEEAWDALEEGWWAWVKADGPHVYVAECDGDRIHRIRRTRKLEQRSPGLVAVGNVEFSWSRVPRVAYDRAWQDAIDTCRAGQPSPVGEWISEAPEDRRMRLRF